MCVCYGAFWVTLCLRLALPLFFVCIYVLSHCIKIRARFCFFFLFLFLHFASNSEFITTHGRCPCRTAFFVNSITFCLSRRRVGAYSARLKSKDLQLEDNRCLICAVMCDEVKADRGTVMNLYEMSCPVLLQSQVACNHSMNYFHFFTSFLLRQ